MRHLANAQYWDRPAGGNTGRLFLAFGGPVCADRFSNCPLDRVLTYKNLIYLLNLQVCGHAMASFDPDDSEQILKLSIPKYKMRKEKKAES